jgi:hypothetical protein
MAAGGCHDEGDRDDGQELGISGGQPPAGPSSARGSATLRACSVYSVICLHTTGTFRVTLYNVRNYYY